MPDDLTGMTGPAITVAGGSVLTLEKLRDVRRWSRRRLITEINRHKTGDPITATVTIRNAEHAYAGIKPGPDLLTAWLRALGLNPNQEVLYIDRVGNRSVIREHTALALVA